LIWANLYSTLARGSETVVFIQNNVPYTFYCDLLTKNAPHLVKLVIESTSNAKDVVLPLDFNPES